MRVIITGAAGLLGRALLKRLHKRQGIELHGIDLRPISLCTPHAVDLTQTAALSELIGTLRPDQVYHLAGTFSNDFRVDFSANVATTRNLLDAIMEHQPATRLLLIGSAAEYGVVSAEENPIREEHPLAPVSMYGWAKVCQTHLMGYYHRVHGTNVLEARLFNLSGPGSPKLFAGTLFEQVERARRGEIAEIVTGPLDAIRDYLSPDSAAFQLEGIMNLGRRGEVYHVASGEPIRMRELVMKVLKQEGLTNFPLREVARSTPGKLDVPCIHADLQKTRALLGEEISVELL